MKPLIDEFCDPSQPTLQKALDEALQNSQFPRRRFPRIRAAVTAFSRLMQRPPTELPGHPGLIIHQMRRLRREPTGLSPKTLSNTKSELLYLLSVVRERGPRSAFLLSEEWGRFRAELGG